MEKWKSVVIMGLLGMMIGYGAFQQKKANEPPPDSQPPQNQETTKLPADELRGKQATAWAIPANNWANTKKPIELKDLKGSVALVEFFRIGCPHCERAAPVIEKMWSELAPRGLKLVAFHSPASAPPPNAAAEDLEMSAKEHSWDTVKTTIVKWGVKYPVAFDEGATVFKSSYKGTTFPSFFLLDKNSKIVDIFYGDKKLPQLRAAVEARLAKK